MSITVYGYTVTLEVGLASAPSTAIGSTSWTDISAYLRSWRTNRGRSSESDTFQPGTLSVTLNNRDRRFDPNNAAGPYFGNLLPMKRIRLKIAYNSITYAVWCGYVDDWPQTYYIGDHEARVDLSATDGFKVLNHITLPESYWSWVVQNTVLVPQPSAWFRLGDQSGTVAVDSSGNGFNGVYNGGAVFNTRAGLIVKTTDNAIAFDGVDDYVTFSPPVTSFPYSVAFAMQAPTASATGRIFTHSSGIGSGITCNIRLSSGTLIAEQLYNDGSVNNRQIRTTTPTYNDNTVHYVVVVFNSNAAAPTIYVDGAAPTSATTGSSGTTLFPPNGTMYLATDNGVTQFAVTLDEVLVYGSDIGAAVSDFYFAASATTFTSRQAVQMIPDLLALVDWPAADETIDTATTSEAFMWFDGFAFPGPQNVLTAVQKAADTDNGQLFMGADGTATYRAGYYRYTNTTSNTSQATFGDSGSELRYSGITPDGGAKLLRNRVRISTGNFSPVDVSDATSITAYLEWVLDLSIGPMSTTTDTSDYVRSLANWKLAQFKNPTQRITELVVMPRRDPTNLFPQVLGRDIGDRLTVKRRPPGGGSANTFTVLIEGVSHQADIQGDWVTTWYLSSADTVSMFILDNAALGLLDTGVLAF